MKQYLDYVESINLASKLSQFSDFWHPRVLGELNGQYVKLAKFYGDFIWHYHEFEDEMFLVLNGRLKMLFCDREVVVNPGEFIIVPKGIVHKPVASQEVHVLLFEPVSTVNTGNINHELTYQELQVI